jgi:hypothetical protein
MNDFRSDLDITYHVTGNAVVDVVSHVTHNSLPETEKPSLGDVDVDVDADIPAEMGKSR